MKRLLTGAILFFLVSAALFMEAGCEKSEPPVNVIKCNAGNAVLSVDGKETAKLPCATSMPAAGRRRVLVQAPGYEEQWVWLTPPEKEKPNEYSIQLEIKKVPVAVESIPAGAGIFIDNVDSGLKTPATLLLEYGTYDLSLQKEGCDQVHKALSINSDAPKKISERMRGTFGELQVFTIPDEADIFLNGKLIGASDYSGYLKEGAYDLRIVLENYGEYTTKIDIIREQQTIIGPVDLKNLPGILKVNCSEDGAEVFIDGKKAGVTPLPAQNLRPGSYEITVKKDGYSDYTGSCRIYSSGTVEMDVPLASYYGSMEFMVEPAGTQVAFDGVLIGIADSEPFKLENLEQGTHQIALLHKNSIPEDTPLYVWVDLKQGEKKILPLPLTAPVANVEIVIENNKPWLGRLALPVDETEDDVIFEPVEGGRVTLRRESIQKIIPLNY